jgi:16S rRNA (cytosine967-C5)-methyltransferase
MVKQWIEMFGIEETAALCRANNQVPPVTVRVNTLRTTRKRTKDELSQHGFDARETAFSPDGLNISNRHTSVRETDCYTSGGIQVQDEASQLIGRLVSPQPGEIVLDLCAGMGGKTAHLAAVMENRGSILALDISRKKIDALRKNVSRLNAVTGGRRQRKSREGLLREFRQNPY